MIATNATAQAENKAVILGFNKKLVAKIAEFQATHPDVRMGIELLQPLRLRHGTNTYAQDPDAFLGCLDCVHDHPEQSN